VPAGSLTSDEALGELQRLHRVMHPVLADALEVLGAPPQPCMPVLLCTPALHSYNCNVVGVGWCRVRRLSHERLLSAARPPCSARLLCTVTAAMVWVGEVWGAYLQSCTPAQCCTLALRACPALQQREATAAMLLARTVSVRTGTSARLVSPAHPLCTTCLALHACSMDGRLATARTPTCRGLGAAGGGRLRDALDGIAVGHWPSHASAQQQDDRRRCKQSQEVRFRQVRSHGSGADLACGVHMCTILYSHVGLQAAWRSWRWAAARRSGRRRCQQPAWPCRGAAAR
jgi:hypothetical protein